MQLNEFGNVIERTWAALDKHFSNITLDEFAIMPNHVHGIVTIEGGPSVQEIRMGEAFGARFNGDENDVRSNASPLRHPERRHLNGTKRGSLGAIVQNFKFVTTRRINRLWSTSGKTVWQRNYYTCYPK